MDLYGRPQAPSTRRASKPSVPFLNERPKSQSFSSDFAAPALSSRDRQSVETLQSRDSLSQTASNNHEEWQSASGPGPQFRPALSARPTSRPQSGGIRRPEADIAHLDARAMMTKPRPRTAREGMRTGMPPQSSFVDTNLQSELSAPVVRATMKRNEYSCVDTKAMGGKDERPETEEARIGDPDREQLYIAQLKDDIICLRGLRSQSNHPDMSNVVQKSSTTHGSHSHVNNVLLIREQRTSGWDSPFSSQSELVNQLKRYNYSSDPFQLSTAKMRLEALLECELTELAQTLVIDCELDADTSADDESIAPDATNHPKPTLVRPRQQNPSGGLRSVRFDNKFAALPFANGCATNAGSIYTGALLSVLEQAERLKQTALASIGEKFLLAKEAANKDNQLRELHEQIAIFKDVIMRARLSVDKDADISLLSRLRIEQERSAAEASNAMAQEFERSKKEHEGTRQQLERKVIDSEKELANTRASLSSAQTTISALQQQIRCAEADTQATTQTIETLRSQQLIAEAAVSKLREQLSVKTNQIDQQNVQLAAANSRSVALEEVVKRETEERARVLQINLELERTLGCNKRDSTSFLADLRALKVDLSTAHQQLQTLQAEKISLNTRINELHAQLGEGKQSIQQKQQLLEVSERKVSMLTQELERQRATARHQENQVQLLEEKLSRSIAVDADAWQKKREEEQSTWHQQLAALEHSLSAEKQQRERLEQLFAREVKSAKENAEHATSRAATLAEELATANLCIAERKRQYEAQKEALEAAVALVEREQGERKNSEAILKMEIRNQMAANQRQQEDTASIVATIKDQLADEQQQKAIVHSQLADLETRLVTLSSSATSEEQSDQMSGTPRRQGHLTAELRVELSRARQKIAALEAKLSKKASESGSASARREREAQESRLNVREKRVTDDQKAIKKLEEKLAGEKQELDGIKRKQDEDKGLLRAIISLLAKRLQTQMALFAAIPGEVSTALEHSRPAATPGKQNYSLATFLAGFEREHVEQWRGLQQLWETLHAELEDADWQLIHMKNRLEELHIEYVGHQVASDSTRVKGDAAGRNDERPQVAVRPFSEAVAAGKETVPVADQLKVSSSTRGPISVSSSLPSPSTSPERRALRAKAEEQETFALALAQEMRAMKERYEKQLEGTRDELRTAQRLRAETAQRLRSDLESERQRHQQTAAQLGERVAALEARVAQLQQLLDARQAAELPLLELLAASPSTASDPQRRAATRQLVQLAAAAGAEAREERERRQALRLAYCGSSSVSVPGRELLGEYPS